MSTTPTLPLRPKSIQVAQDDFKAASEQAVHYLLRKDGIAEGRKAGLVPEDFYPGAPSGPLAKVLCNGSQEPEGLIVVGEKCPQFHVEAANLAESPPLGYTSHKTAFQRLKKAKAELELARAYQDGNLDQLAELVRIVRDIERGVKVPGHAVRSAADMMRTEYKAEAAVIGRGILPEGGGMILAGESGVGKSMFRTELAVHLAMGWDFLGMPVPTARRVFILQFENTERTEAYRLKAITRGLGITDFPDRLSFADPTTRLDLGKPQGVNLALAIIEESGADVVVFDPLSSLHSVNENDNIQIRRVLDNITEINRRAGVSSIVVHHFGKPGPDGPKKVAYRLRGASSIRDWADTLLALTHEKSRRRIIRKMDLCKVRNGPEPPASILERDKNTFLSTITEDESSCSPGTVRDIVRELGGRVEGQGPLIEAIKEKIGCGTRTAKTCIGKAVEMKAIKEGPNPNHAQGKIYYA